MKLCDKTSLTQGAEFVKEIKFKGVIKITRQKTTPWKTVNKFKKRKSTKTVGHPVWVYRKRGRYYKYLTFTHKPTNDEDFEELKYNIDPQDPTRCYVKKKYDINHSNAFADADKKYRIHPKDKYTVKKYQK